MFPKLRFKSTLLTNDIPSEHFIAGLVSSLTTYPEEMEFWCFFLFFCGRGVVINTGYLDVGFEKRISEVISAGEKVYIKKTKKIVRAKKQSHPQHEILNLRFRKDVVKKALRSSLLIFTSFFRLS